MLVNAAPLYLSIGTGLFSLYLYSTSSYQSLRSCRMAFLMCMLVPLFLVIDSVVALVVLGNDDPSFELVHTEYVLQAVVRLSLYLLTALMLHPSTLSVFLARPAFDYSLQATLVWVIVAATICASILDIVASFVHTIPSTVSIISILAPLLNFGLLLRVAGVSRKWKLSNSTGTWILLAMLQLPALSIAIVRAWPPSTPSSIAIRFSLLIWTTGTLTALSNLTPSSLSKPPALKQYSLATRRVSHTTVSEDFQSNHDPFAGPHQHRYRHPSLIDTDTYDYGDDGSSRCRKGAIRTQYSSESSTRWLLPHPNLKSLPSLPLPVHLEPPVDAIAEIRFPGTNRSNTSLSLPVKSAQGVLVTISRDRTPTQSLYVPEAPLSSILATESGEDIPLSSPEAYSLPSMASFELETPDQTFSSEAETAAASEPALGDIPLGGNGVLGAISSNDDAKDLEGVIP